MTMVSWASATAIAVSLILLPGWASAQLNQAFVDPAVGVDNFTCGSFNSPCETISQAIGLTVAGGAILLKPGTYSSYKNLDLNFGGRGISLASTDGPEVTVIDGEGRSRIFAFINNDPNTTMITGVTLYRGASPTGGCVLIGENSHVTIVNSIFRNCEAKPVIGYGSNGMAANSGGAIYVRNGNLRLVNTTFENNRALRFAGSVYVDNSYTDVNNCSFNNDTASLDGGSVYYKSDMSSKLVNSVWKNCSANANAGAIFVESDSNTTVQDCKFTCNTAAEGGAVFHGNSDRLWVKNSEFRDNKAHNGSAARIADFSSPIYENCSFIANKAESFGTVYADGAVNLTINRSLFAMNSANQGGGGLYMNSRSSSSIVDTSFFENNSSTQGGALLFEDSAVASIVNLECDKNWADIDGGCIKAANNVRLVIANSTIKGNSASVYAGALLIEDRVTASITNISLISNKAGQSGGAMWLTGYSALSADNCTFADNNADENGGGIVVNYNSRFTAKTLNLVNNSAGRGGALFLQSKTPINVESSTFATNEADFGAAVYIDVPSKNNEIKNSKFKMNRAQYGGIIYYNDWAKLLDCDCAFTDNSAAYGLTEATKPRWLNSTQALMFSVPRNEKFNISATLTDHFGNVVTSGYNIANLRPTSPTKNEHVNITAFGVAKTSEIPFIDSAVNFVVATSLEVGKMVHLELTANQKGVKSLMYMVTITDTSDQLKSDGTGKFGFGGIMFALLVVGGVTAAVWRVRSRQARNNRDIKSYQSLNELSDIQRTNLH